MKKVHQEFGVVEKTALAKPLDQGTLPRYVIATSSNDSTLIGSRSEGSLLMEESSSHIPKVQAAALAGIN